MKSAFRNKLTQIHTISLLAGAASPLRPTPAPQQLPIQTRARARAQPQSHIGRAQLDAADEERVAVAEDGVAAEPPRRGHPRGRRPQRQLHLPAAGRSPLPAASPHPSSLAARSRRF